MGFFDSIGNALGVAGDTVAGGLGSVLGLGANLIGGVNQNNANWDIAQAANAQSAANTNATNQFNAQQYATRYQTTVKDLMASGLNPMLAYGQGAGTPIAAQAPQVNTAAPRHNVLANATDAFNTFRMTNADVNLKDANVNQTNANTSRIFAETINTKAQLYQILANTDLTYSQRAKIEKEIQTLDHQQRLIDQNVITSSAQAGMYGAMSSKLMKESDILDPQAKFSGSGWGQISPYIDKGLSYLGDVAGILKPKVQITNHYGNSRR